jgi:hypothetical protein
MSRHKRTKVDYRKIYEQHYGSIPYDEYGRRFDIHHIDGDDENNDPTNLVALSIQDHYDVHYAQEDYYACYLMAIHRLNKSQAEISKIATLNNLKRVKDGTNPLVGGKLQSKTQLRIWSELGDKHPLAVSQRKRLEEGTHHLQGGGSSHPCYDATEHSFENTKTGERVTMPQNDFFKKYNLHSGSVSDMVNGERGVQSVKGWVLIDPSTNLPVVRVNNKRDNSVYEFKHKKTNETVQMTRKQMCDAYEIKANALCEVVTGNRKSTSGWSLVKKINSDD